MRISESNIWILAHIWPEISKETDYWAFTVEYIRQMRAAQDSLLRGSDVPLEQAIENGKKLFIEQKISKTISKLKSSVSSLAMNAVFENNSEEDEILAIVTSHKFPWVVGAMTRSDINRLRGMVFWERNPDIIEWTVHEVGDGMSTKQIMDYWRSS